MGKNKGQDLTELDDLESASASDGDYWKAANFEGRVHLIKPYRLDPDAFASSGGANPEAVIADVVVLGEGSDATEVFSQAKVGGKAVINQLAGPIARQTRLVGRLRKVQPEGKGRNPYWAFDPATDKDLAVARAFLNSANPL